LSFLNGSIRNPNYRGNPIPLLSSWKNKNLDSRLKILGMTNENHKGVSPPYNPKKLKNKNIKKQILLGEEKRLSSGKRPSITPQSYRLLEDMKGLWYRVSLISR